MKIPSATGFAVVCTTELAFEYLKQTEQIKLIDLYWLWSSCALIQIPGVSLVHDCPFYCSSFTRHRCFGASWTWLSMHHSMFLSNLNRTTLLIHRHARQCILTKTAHSIQLASSGDWSPLIPLWTIYRLFTLCKLRKCILPLTWVICSTEAKSLFKGC